MVITVIWASILAAAVSLAFFLRREAETDPLKQGKKSARLTALVEPFLLPLCLLTIFLTWLVLRGFEQAWTVFFILCVPLFLFIGLYYAALLCVLPLLRRFFSAHCCAVLWLLPNFLYLTFNIRTLSGHRMAPLFVLTVPRRWMWLIALIWAAGFALVLLWQIVSHLCFRRDLLRAAIPVDGGDIRSLWRAEQKRRSVKDYIPILVSPNAPAPLTIGLFNRTQRLVLPHTNYTQEELKLIFAHEMRHIQRADTRTKAFLGFCTAMCWFNPLMWIARRRASDDLELSCDELVLSDAVDAVRTRYAGLLLDTAGGGRGYTTCLSASAASLRYRLKNVVKPRSRLPGSLAVGLVLFLLILGSGAFALADSPGTVRSLVFDQAPAGSAPESVSVNSWPDAGMERGMTDPWDAQALTEYLAALSIRPLYTELYPEDPRHQLTFTYAAAENGEVTSRTFLTLCDGFLLADIPFDGFNIRTFALDDEIDWDHIEALLNVDA